MQTLQYIRYESLIEFVKMNKKIVFINIYEHTWSCYNFQLIDAKWKSNLFLFLFFFFFCSLQ